MLAATEPLLASHVRLWNSPNVGAHRGWAGLRDRCSYLWDRLTWHASRAALNSADLRSIALDADWLVERIRFDGV
ncbi:MAG: hypothetical protein IPG46_03725, partial [Actinobacteria bacterium]|nr:hypothetical protein [Actinomycetota bacterium]